MLVSPNILLLSNDDVEIEALQDLLSAYMLLSPVTNLMDLSIHLKHSNYDTVLCSWSFHQGFWSEAIEEVRMLDPDLPVVILCKSGGEREWVRALESGAFDLLVAPFRKADLLRVVEQAGESFRARRRRFSSFHSSVQTN